MAHLTGEHKGGVGVCQYGTPQGLVAEGFDFCRGMIHPGKNYAEFVIRKGLVIHPPLSRIGYVGKADKAAYNDSLGDSQ